MTSMVGPLTRPHHARAQSPARAAARSLRRHWLGVAVVVLLAAVVAAGTTFWAQGYRAYVVHTGSMMPTLNPGDLAIDAPVHGALHRGEIITFRHSDLTTDVVTHRVHGFTKNGLILTKGDANATPDAWQIRPSQVRGRVTHKVIFAGYLVVFFQHPVGVAALAVSLLALILLYQLFFDEDPPADRASRRHRGRRSA